MKTQLITNYILIKATTRRMSNDIIIPKGLWIQSKNAEGIPFWNLNDCIYFLSLSDSTKRNLPGNAKLMAVKEAVGERIYELIQALHESALHAAQTAERQNNFTPQNFDYPLLVDTFNLLIFIMSSGCPGAIQPSPIQSTSTLIMQQSICCLHDYMLQETSFHKIKRSKIFQSEADNDLLATLGTTSLDSSPKMQETASCGAMMEPSSSAPTHQRGDPSIFGMRLQSHQIEMTCVEDIPQTWTLDMCISYLLLSEPCQNKLPSRSSRYAGSYSTVSKAHLPSRSRNLKMIKETVCSRIRSLLEEHFSLAAIHVKQKNKHTFLTVVVDTLNMLINSVRCTLPKCPITLSNLSVESLLLLPDSLRSPMSGSCSNDTTTKSLQKLNLQAQEIVKLIDTYNRHQLLLLQFQASQSDQELSHRVH
jgi:hypothetical protein